METTNKTRYKQGKNPNSLKNLHPFLPGNHASPGRPPKEDCLLSCIKEELSKKAENGIDTNEQIIAWALISKAKSGDSKAIELILSYLHSKPTASVNLSGTSELLVKWDGNRNMPKWGD